MLLLGLGLFAGAAHARLEWAFDGPERFGGLAVQLERETAGLARLERLTGAPSTLEPIRVELVAESTEVARRTPQWIAGYAQGAAGRIVLFPERVPRYPNGSLEEVFRHELLHVLVARATAGRPVPRWFNEGLSTVGATSWDMGDRSRLTWALLFRGRRELSDLDRLFQDGSTAPAAYAISAAFVRDLLRRHGSGVAARILGEVRRGALFDAAFVSATGTTLAQAQDRFWGTHSLLYRWIPVISSSLTLWIGVTALFLLAAGRRRRRDARIRELWDAEEEARIQPDVGGWIH